MAASLFSSLSPINSFPSYHGPYEVGTVDVEIPAADLPAPCAVPDDAPPTIAFRMFYPCIKPASAEANRAVRWIPQPQRLTTAALLKFLGIKEKTAGLGSYFLQHLYWINLQAYRNARLLEAPTSDGRWPVAFFSHGLAGSRNAYSYICGDLASNGMIVIALDHRDGSSPIQYVRPTTTREGYIVDTKKISHEPNQEVFEARDKQLRIRLWELSLALEALLKIDAGQEVENLDMNTGQNRKERVEVLWQFDGKLDILRAGKVSWVGHSFGAATITQLVKSVYYSSERPKDAGKPLMTPRADAAILHQVMPESPVALLDLWCLPLLSPDQKYLLERPLPGSNVLSVLSEAFFNWKENLKVNKDAVRGSSERDVSPAPRLAREKGKLLPAWSRLQDHSPSRDSGYGSQTSQSRSRSPISGERGDHRSISKTQGRYRRPARSRGPRMFYVQRSQHFNQSDFGILFPFLARRFTKAEEPERILELNTRAIVETMREAGIEVSGQDDIEILDEQGDIRSWLHITIDSVQPAAATHGDIDASQEKLSITASNQSAAPADAVVIGDKKAIEVDC